MSLTLALETSSRNYGIALGAGQHILVQRECRNDDPSFGSIGELTASLINDAGAKISDISLIGIDVGPGSLSSVRSGVAYANGLAFSLGATIFAASSLELLARQSWLHSSFPVLCMRKAQGGNAYVGLFVQDQPPELLYGPCAELIAKLASGTRELSVAGAYRSLPAEIIPRTKVYDTGLDIPDVAALYKLTADPASSFGRLDKYAMPLNEAAPVFYH
jgi:tRNA threonylcarbamoyladenosine biosynthesis protein TsaB